MWCHLKVFLTFCLIKHRPGEINIVDTGKKQWWRWTCVRKCPLFQRVKGCCFHRSLLCAHTDNLWQQICLYSRAHLIDGAEQSFLTGAQYPGFVWWGMLGRGPCLVLTFQFLGWIYAISEKKKSLITAVVLAFKGAVVWFERSGVGTCMDSAGCFWWLSDLQTQTDLHLLWDFSCLLWELNKMMHCWKGKSNLMHDNTMKCCPWCFLHMWLCSRKIGTAFPGVP